MRIEKLESQGAEGKQLAQQDKWNDLILSASGEKPLQDAAKIKKAMKRMDKAKGKSAREWQERLQELETAKDKKLEQREANLLKRKPGFKDTKANASADTTTGSKEKLRPGFEGKKAEFLNNKKHSSSAASADK